MAKKEIDEAFMIIEKPNNFVKTVNTNIDCSELSKAQTERLNFWNKFNEIVASRNKLFNIRKVTKDYWYDVAL